jgi:hypothetical protein
MSRFLRILGMVLGLLNIGIGVLVDKLNPVIAGCSIMGMCFLMAYLMDFNWKN